MAAKRTTGAAQRGGRSGASAQKGRDKASATRVPTPLRGSARGDIVGLFIAVLAIAMMVAVVSPSSAPVTYATHYVLQLVFGAGALLFPLSLLIFAATFFVDIDNAMALRITLGLTLVVVSLLSIVSLNVAGAEANPDLVLDVDVAMEAGGYVGGGIAWALLKTVGLLVGDVVLGGFIVAGVVVSGFSISGAVSTVREKAADDHTDRQQRLQSYLF